MRFGFLFVVLGGLCAFATAQTAAVISFAPDGRDGSYYAETTGDTIGWNFYTREAITITHLGVWIDDDSVSPGMNSPHEVGIWDWYTHVLLTSTTVNPATAIEKNGFKYQPIADLDLDAEGLFVIGAVYRPDDGDYYMTRAFALTTSPQISYSARRWPYDPNLNLEYPGYTGAANPGGHIGPNFLFTPEPQAVALLALATMLLRRRCVPAYRPCSRPFSVFSGVEERS